MVRITIVLPRTHKTTCPFERFASIKRRSSFIRPCMYVFARYIAGVGRYRPRIRNPRFCFFANPPPGEGSFIIHCFVHGLTWEQIRVFRFVTFHAHTNPTHPRRISGRNPRIRSPTTTAAYSLFVVVALFLFFLLCELFLIVA